MVGRRHVELHFEQAEGTSAGKDLHIIDGGGGDTAESLEELERAGEQDSSSSEPNNRNETCWSELNEAVL